MVNADDFMESLFNGGYVNRYVWKNINKQTTRYNISFICQKCKLNSYHSFKIIVINDKHYIDMSAIKYFCKIHGIN